MAHLESVDMTKTKRARVSGARLREARDKAGLSQEDLAGLLDVRVPTISERENSGDDTEKGEGVPWETWLAWAYACGVKPGAKPTKPTRSPRRKPEA